MKTYCIAFLFSCLFSISARGAENSFIGKEFPPLPVNCEDKAGGLMGSTSEFAYDHIVCGSENIVLLQKFVAQRERKAYYTVLDELRIPTLKSGSEILDIPLCESKKHIGETVVVIGSWVKSKNGDLVGTNISQAWWLNTKTQKITPISVAGISCESADD